MTSNQKSILDNVLLSYYHQFFNTGNIWYEHKNTEELLTHLEKYNVHEEDIISELKEESQSKNYYQILGISFDATTEEIKKEGRKLIAEAHPDKNRDNPEYDAEKFYQVYEAYETLSDENKRKIYNETQLILIKANEMIKRQENDDDWDEGIRNAVIKKIRDFEKKLTVN